MTETNRTTLPEYCFTPVSDHTTRWSYRTWATFTEEVWRIITDWPDYAVSNWGRVRRETKGWHAKAGRLLRGAPSGPNRYLTVHLWRDGKRTTATIHRLVATAFILADDPEKTHVDHLDDDPANNCAWNLEWVTQTENNNRIASRHRSPSGASHYYHTRPNSRRRNPSTGQFG